MEDLLLTGELSINQVRITDVSHCDGLLLCTLREGSRIVVWNPCTHQTKWIQTSECRWPRFVLENYRDDKSGNKSYKILNYWGYNSSGKDFDIYDINSDSWRNLDVTPIPDYMCPESRVSLKGKTYWFLWFSTTEIFGSLTNSFAFPMGLISFDYTTERFERLLLPCQFYTSGNYSLSVVGEEKLSDLLKHTNSARWEVWITKKIDDETKKMSWSKLLEVGVGPGRAIWFGRRFLVDEEKKIVIVCCERDHNKPEPVITLSNDGADSKVYFQLRQCH